MPYQPQLRWPLAGNQLLQKKSGKLRRTKTLEKIPSYIIRFSDPPTSGNARPSRSIIVVRETKLTSGTASTAPRQSSNHDTKDYP